MITLNQQQQSIVNKINGSCLVIAGAGSGKTRVIIQKILHLIKHGYKANNIYAITFTNKSAKEMQDRLLEASDHYLNNQDPTSLKKVHISTFHTLGLAIIKQHSKDLNFKSKVILFDSYDQRILIQEILEKYSLDYSLAEEINQISNYISLCKNRLIYTDKHNSNPIENYEFGDKYWSIYQNYVSYMHSISAVDFDDLLMLPCYLFSTNQLVLNKWQKQINYLLVDEYQDTNFCQLQLIRLLMQNSPNFTMVGDDDQSIYSWRGADSRNMELLSTYFPDLEIFKLEQNYRSTQLILNCANKLIDNNPHIYNKTLYSNNNFGEKIDVITIETPEDEAIYIAGQIQSRVSSSCDLKYSDIAILYRSNYQSREFENALTQREIPYSLNGDNSFYELSEIRDVIAYLKILDNPNDDKSILRIINKPSRKIGAETVESLGIIAKKNDCSIHDACWHHDLIELIQPASYKSLNQFLDLLDQTTRELQNTGDAKIFSNFIAAIGYYEYLAINAKNKKQLEEQIDNVKRLLKWINNWMSSDYGNPLTLNEVVNKLFMREIFSNKKDKNLESVQMMTMHASKGLEFKIVYIVGVEEGIIPHSNHEGNEEGIQEERRLFYVSITRAQEKLIISHVNKRKSGGEEIEILPSSFLTELPEEHLERINCSAEAVKQRREIVKQRLKQIIGSFD